MAGVNAAGAPLPELAPRAPSSLEMDSTQHHKLWQGGRMVSLLCLLAGSRGRALGGGAARAGRTWCTHAAARRTPCARRQACAALHPSGLCCRRPAASQPTTPPRAAPQARGSMARPPPPLRAVAWSPRCCSRSCCRSASPSRVRRAAARTAWRIALGASRAAHPRLPGAPPAPPPSRADPRACATPKHAPLATTPPPPAGISSASLAAAGVALPTSQSVLNYALLAATFGGARLAAGGPLARPWWCYALLALCEVEANFLVVKAYQFTSLTSVTLLDCFTIPAVIALSYFVLGARYRRPHYAAAAVCVAGLALLVGSEGASDTAGAAPLLGDALVVAGALLYACSNVTQELFLGAASVPEVLGMVGAFGALIAAAQAAALEHGAWADLLSGGASLGGVGAAFGAFTAALFTFSALVPVVLVWGGATALNLSLLTSDMWAAAARVALFGGFGGGGGWFGASLALVAAGLCLYACAGSPRPPPQRAARAGSRACLRRASSARPPRPPAARSGCRGARRRRAAAGAGAMRGRPGMGMIGTTGMSGASSFAPRWTAATLLTSPGPQAAAAVRIVDRAACLVAPQRAGEPPRPAPPRRARKRRFAKRGGAVSAPRRRAPVKALREGACFLFFCAPLGVRMELLRGCLVCL
ncbi:MAG: hypothetical protein J3K34DRAFT_259541 [Monoraphidium minutum]|nr:MAG: hypothetical protein J3K34DRAFT_259541 [Monoraphidium minutum]